MRHVVDPANRNSPLDEQLTGLADQHVFREVTAILAELRNSSDQVPPDEPDRGPPRAPNEVDCGPPSTPFYVPVDELLCIDRAMSEVIEQAIALRHSTRELLEIYRARREAWRATPEGTARRLAQYERTLQLARENHEDMCKRARSVGMEPPPWEPPPRPVEIRPDREG